MRFSEYNAIQIERARQARLLDKVTNRRWRIAESSNLTGDACEVNFYISSWWEDHNEIKVGTGMVQSSLDYCTPRQLRQIAAVKQLYADWASGELVELPTDMPDAIKNLL